MVVLLDRHIIEETNFLLFLCSGIEFGLYSISFLSL